MLYPDQEDKFKLNSNKKAILITGGTTSAIVIASASPLQAQTAASAVTVSDVNTQLQAAQSGVLALGSALIGMALGITLFIIGKRVMDNTTKK
jgi:hypothetical protein